VPEALLKEAATPRWIGGRRSSGDGARSFGRDEVSGRRGRLEETFRRSTTAFAVRQREINQIIIKVVDGKTDRSLKEIPRGKSSACREDPADDRLPG